MKNQKGKNNPHPILITGGDPAGISPEILIGAIPAIRSSKYPVLYFSTSDSKQTAKFLSASKKSNLTSVVLSLKEYEKALQYQNFPNDRRNQITIVDLTSVDIYRDWSPGNPGKGSGMLAFEALRRACDYILSSGCSGLVTAPLSKEWVSEGIQTHFSGHTDYLAERFQTDVLMLMHGRKFSVIPLTVHIPLSKVSQELKKTVSSETLSKLLRLTNQLAVFSKKKWALCGINPHSGEGGHIGSEEVDFLNQAAENWRRIGLPVDGPFSADGIFMKDNLINYRLVLSAYHDQGLIPFKALEGNSGINVTVGLPFLRTSPDHGTAFGISGKGKADPRSMIHAFRALSGKELTFV
ncbi:MAG: 4-hydroxythreonine-4-phosphate dehydrogenase PdxA [Spirochaetia bacterium]|nr:4-hydroxythreonine-4-phosphate dehydrogenase PdxA [Spirochaetia bacterium]